MPFSDTTSCPCGDGLFTLCCGRFILRGLIPQSALLLMRSRYSAFTLRDEPYLRLTWHRSTRPRGPVIDDDEKTQWLELEIRQHSQEESTATVEFVARYKIAGRAHRLHEVSHFVREVDNNVLRWFYVDGSFPER